MTEPIFTERGFAVYASFSDDHGHEVRVQESSAASEPKVWVFIGNSPHVKGQDLHLTTDQARRLRDALNAFLTEGSAHE